MKRNEASPGQCTKLVPTAVLRANPHPRPRFRLEFTCRFESEEELAMKHLSIFCLLLVLSFAMSALGQSAGTAPKPAAPTSPAQTTSPSQQAPQPPPTIAGVVDRQVSQLEKQVVDVAEAMPEDKFDF